MFHDERVAGLSGGAFVVAGGSSSEPIAPLVHPGAGSRLRGMPLPRSVVPVLRHLFTTVLDVACMALVTWSAAFTLLTWAPGSPQALAQTVAGGAQRLDASASRAWTAGFDQQQHPVARWWSFVSGMGHGDFGWSWSQQRPVSAVLIDTLPYTVSLALPALLLALSACVWLGTRGVRPGAPARWSMVPSAMRLLGAIPPAWLALAMALLFAGTLRLLPLQGVCNPRDCVAVSLWAPATLLARLPYAVLPILTLGLVLLPTLTRLQWQTSHQAQTLPHVTAAQARGIPASVIVRRHVWRLTWSPMASTVALILPALLGGAVFVERVFAWPGMGSVLLQAVNLRDYGLVATMSGCIAALSVLCTRLLELLVPFMDPRAITEQ